MYDINNVFRQRHTIAADSRIDKLRRFLPISLEVVKDQWDFADQYAAGPPRHRMALDVPRSDIGADVIYDVYTFKPRLEFVQIFLVREPSLFAPVITPFDTFIPPPAQACQASVIAPEKHERDIVLSALFLVFETRREPVGNDGNRARSDFLEERLRIGKKYRSASR